MSKVIAKYDQWGRMGNRMFVYALARIIALQKNADLFADPISTFSETYNHHKTNNINGVNNVLDLRKTYGNNYVDINAVLNHDGDILVNSYAQNANYFYDKRDLLKQWFAIDTSKYILPEDNEVVIHIREGDYKSINKWIGEDYYLNQIKENSDKKITIVTDNCEALFIKSLENNNCKILTKLVPKFTVSNDDSSMQDYVYMLYAEYLVLSQSTFCWWPAFLGDHKKVICPISDKPNSLWKETPQIDDINLFIDTFERISV